MTDSSADCWPFVDLEIKVVIYCIYRTARFTYIYVGRNRKNLQSYGMIFYLMKIM